MKAQKETGQDTNQPREQQLPRSVVLGAVLAVFAVNLTILGYAISVSQPFAEAQAQPALGGAGAGQATLRPALDVSSRIGAPAELEEEMEWAPELIPVVNIFDLPSPEEIRPLFIHHCAGCHGVEGRGDGPAADQLVPPPRDFFGSVFRYASSGSDREHVLADLERTIGSGVPRSAMPGFGRVLTESEILGLARYALAIREHGEQMAPPEPPIDIGDRPPITPHLLARGKELYTLMACNTCHGDSGRGDGPNAQALVDFQNRPVRPADFTSGLFKTGQTPEDLCRTVLRGVPGTPMVAYEAVLAQENEDGTLNTMDAWAVVTYIRSFARDQPPGVASGASIVAVIAADESMIFDPAHLAWLGVEPTLIRVKPLQTRPEQTIFIEVRAVRTADRLAICLDWRDATMDLARGEDVYPDAASVMFGLSGEVPALPMAVEIAEHEPKEPAYLWYWSADRQLDAVGGGRNSDITRVPEASGGWYLFVEGPRARLPRTNVVEDSEANFRPRSRAVLEGNALGLGQIDLQPADQQTTEGAASWATGSWRIVVHRSLAADCAEDADFTSARRVPVSFAIWDGAKGDHAGIKLVSSWHWLSATQ